MHNLEKNFYDLKENSNREDGIKFFAEFRTSLEKGEIRAAEKNQRRMEGKYLG